MPARYAWKRVSVAARTRADRGTLKGLTAAQSTRSTATTLVKATGRADPWVSRVVCCPCLHRPGGTACVTPPVWTVSGPWPSPPWWRTTSAPPAPRRAARRLPRRGRVLRPVRLPDHQPAGRRGAAARPDLDQELLHPPGPAAAARAVRAAAGRRRDRRVLAAATGRAAPGRPAREPRLRPELVADRPEQLLLRHRRRPATHADPPVVAGRRGAVLPDLAADPHRLRGRPGPPGDHADDRPGAGSPPRPSSGCCSTTRSRTRPGSTTAPTPAPWPRCSAPRWRSPIRPWLHRTAPAPRPAARAGRARVWPAAGSPGRHRRLAARHRRTALPRRVPRHRRRSARPRRRRRAPRHRPRPGPGHPAAALPRRALLRHLPVALAGLPAHPARHRHPAHRLGQRRAAHRASRSRWPRSPTTSSRSRSAATASSPRSADPAPRPPRRRSWRSPRQLPPPPSDAMRHDRAPAARTSGLLAALAASLPARPAHAAPTAAHPGRAHRPAHRSPSSVAAPSAPWD